MKKTTFLIVGKHAVLEALKNPNRKIERVFLTEDAQKKLNRENQNLNLFKKINVFYKSRKELDNLCGRDETAHQGLVAEVEQIEEITLKEFIIDNKKKNINLLALEEVSDPRNIGSIIRSAVAFNVDGIIVKERSYPSKSKLLYKSASGGAEHIKIFQVSNVNTALKYLKTKEFWVSAFDVSAQKDFTEHKWYGKNILLFGSEGYGIKTKTLENADFKFRVNMNNNIESLNISNTVSVVCHHIFQSIK
ncbi:MAG: 23S rRNA (guanosine(2251)-2'-O)-methyltransferase RlmB [Candidatus Pelagibacter bacterium]|nr:23S rRNA (guanosine(2251)-2'-O)-methyltransferase RlmB [Candidatus Pelagibacter bacterium]MBL6860932.1 23S rRNA (guanosine(2251)-2'-O)-methyltransferase RlmB [Candidatus Pelagibacter bacterium]